MLKRSTFRASQTHLHGSSLEQINMQETMPWRLLSCIRELGTCWNVLSNAKLSRWPRLKVTYFSKLYILSSMLINYSLGMALAPWNVLAAGKIRTDAEEEARRQSNEKGRTYYLSRWERNEKEKLVCKALEKVAEEIGAKHITAGTPLSSSFPSLFDLHYLFSCDCLSYAQDSICLPNCWRAQGRASSREHRSSESFFDRRSSQVFGKRGWFWPRVPKLHFCKWNCVYFIHCISWWRALRREMVRRYHSPCKLQHLLPFVRRHDLFPISPNRYNNLLSYIQRKYNST